MSYCYLLPHLSNSQQERAPTKLRLYQTMNPVSDQVTGTCHCSNHNQCILLITNHSNTIPFHIKWLCSIQLPVGQRKPPEVLRDKKMSKLQELREREIAFKESYSIFDEMFMCFRCLFDWTQQCAAVLRNHISCSLDHLEQIKVAVCEVYDKDLKWFISCLLKMWFSCKYVFEKWNRASCKVGGYPEYLLCILTFLLMGKVHKTTFGVTIHMLGWGRRWPLERLSQDMCDFFLW